MVISLLVLAILCGALTHGASISKHPRQSFPVNHFYNASNIKVFVTNYNNSSSSNSRDKTLQYRILHQDMELLLTSFRKMEKMMGVLNGTRRDIQDIKSFMNATKVKLESIENNSKQRNATKRRKLAIFFKASDFKLKNPHTLQGAYGGMKYIFKNNCLLDSAPSFTEVRRALDLYFRNAREIYKIRQGLGYARNGKIVVRVTTPDGAVSSSEHCGESDHYNSNDMVDTWEDYFYIQDQKRLMMCTGDRRTMVWIFKS